MGRKQSLGRSGEIEAEAGALALGAPVAIGAAVRDDPAAARGLSR
jgi:hypothetical protein